MRPINRQRVGSQGVVLPKLTADMVPGDKPVLTVAKVQEFNGRDGPFLSIIFGEFPEHSYNTNSTQEDALLALVDARKLPNDFDLWPGKRIPFYKRENVYNEGGVSVKAIKLYAQDAQDYETALAAWDANKQPVPQPGKETGRRSAR
jgi:hypothetical protein